MIGQTTVGWTEGRTDTRALGRSGGRTDGGADGRSNARGEHGELEKESDVRVGRIDGRSIAWLVGRADGQCDGRTFVQTRVTFGQAERLTEGRSDRPANSRLADGPSDGRMH